MTSHTEALLKEAAQFHGHLGPYLVLGLRMGMLAKTLLGGNPFNMKADIHAQKNPPQSCILDGVQITSGCTFGKRNIHLEEDSSLYGVFTKDSETVTIRVNPHIVNSLRNIPRAELEVRAKALFEKRDDELFEVIE